MKMFGLTQNWTALGSRFCTRCDRVAGGWIFGKMGKIWVTGWKWFTG